MAFASVQIGPGTPIGTGSVAVTMPVASTAGTLLVACCFNSSGNGFTGPAGWTVAAGGTLVGVTVFCYPGNPGGITTATFTATGNCRGVMSEWSTAAGTTQTVDATGTAAGSTGTTSFPVTATGSSAAGDLGIAAFEDAFSTATTGASWTPPTGYTDIHHLANLLNTYSASYKIGLGAGVQSVTGSYSSSSHQTGWGGVFVAFKENTASGLSVTTASLPAGLVGVPYQASLAAAGGTPPYSWAVTVGSLNAGLSLAASGGRGGLSGITMAAAQKPSPSIATANWEALTGVPCLGRKCYFQTHADGSGIFPTVPDNTIQDCIDNSLVLYLCVKPALNPPTTKDYNGLQASVAAMVALGLTVKVICWQEVEDQVSSSTLYKAALVYYAPAIHAAGGTLVHDSAGSKHLLWASYFPVGASLAVVDEYMIDFYGNTYASGGRIDTFMAMAAATGLRVGVGEMGTCVNTAQPPSEAVQTDYLNYINGFAAALPPGLYAWYEQDNKNIANAITDPNDFRIPLLQQIATTIAGTTTGGGTITGTPTTAATSSFTVRATDTNSVTATAALGITVTSIGLPVITTTSLPAATTGVAYTLTALTETGGTAPFTWAVTAGALPDGLTLGPLGYIFGTPTAAAATSGFTVTVTDGNNLADSQSLFITVVTASPPPSPAPQRPGWPQLIIEAGLQAAAPQVPAGTFLLDDPVYGILDTGVLGDSTVWTDITLFARTVTITRPSTRVQGPLLTYQGGNSSVTLKNGDGRFDPDNGASPYAGSIRPMVPFRFRAVYGNIEYHLFSGFTGSWITPDINLGPNYSEITVTADDGFKILAGVTIPTGGSTGSSGAGDGEDSGARVTRILNAAAWYTDHRSVNVGDSSLQGTQFGSDALSLLQLTADSEIGELYMDGGGNVVFRNRQAIITDARSTQVQAILGDLPGTVHGSLTELPYTGVSRADDDTQLCNDVQATSVGLDLQEAESASSQRTYLFPRTYARSDLILEDDPTTLEWAQWVLSVSLAGDSRFDAVTVSPLRDPGLWPHILSREIGDRVTVIRRPPGGVAAISRDCFIRGITHQIDASAGTWQTTWDLQSALRYTGFLILDDAVNGLLDTGKLAF